MHCLYWVSVDVCICACGVMGVHMLPCCYCMHGLPHSPAACHVTWLPMLSCHSQDKMPWPHTDITCCLQCIHTKSFDEAVTWGILEWLLLHCVLGNVPCNTCIRHHLAHEQHEGITNGIQAGIMMQVIPIHVSHDSFCQCVYQQCQQMPSSCQHASTLSTPPWELAGLTLGGHIYLIWNLLILY